MTSFELDNTVGRRRVTQAAMWAAPVIAVSSAAPAFAASSMPIFTSSTYRHFDTGTATTCGTGAQFRIEQNAGVGFLKVDGLLAGDVLSKLSTTFYVALPAGVTWTRTGSSCWTTPVESTALNMTVGGHPVPRLHHNFHLFPDLHR